MKLPKLFKKTSTGKIQEWEIWTSLNTIYTSTGQVDGKKTQFEDTIKEGKNLGKTNETSVVEQAEAEAKAKWEKQLKKGYVSSPEDAAEGKVNKEFVVGGYKPMLAHKFKDQSKKIIYPAYVQPKLDGIRACLDEGKLFTRTQKPINTCAHIEEQLEEMGFTDFKLDGELYNHLFKEDFEKISSAVRKEKEDSPYRMDINYHVYDVNIDAPFEERLSLLEDLNRAVAKYYEKHDRTFIYAVRGQTISGEEGVERLAKAFQNGGYEGAMVRNLNSPYEGKRSYHLQKVKFFQDKEFKIVGVEDGKGKMAGLASRFILEIDDEYGKREFKATPNGNLQYLKELYDNPSMWEGKMATVTYQGYTVKNKVPRIPKVKEIRDLNY